ncbi:MAG: hypothetical protein V4527_06055 [Pseudomonadota bacterium]
MKIRLCAVLAGASLAILLAGPAAAKAVHHPSKAHAAHRDHSGRHYVQSFYDYRSASFVREEFIDAPRGRWMDASRDGYDGRYDFRDRRDGRVVENLRGDFTGGVGYGADGGAASFVDGYGQTHFFVGSFRQMNRLPHGPYRPNRFAPSQGFHRRF